MAAASELDLLITFAIILIAAELGSILFQWARLPRLLGMLVAGVVIGPSVNPFTEQIRLDAANVSDLAFLGSIFLMFSIGLSFNLRTLRGAGGGGLVLGFVGAMFSFLVGLTLGLAFGQPLAASIFFGLLLAPTSSTIALRLAEEQNLLATPGIETTTSGIILDDVIALFFATLALGFLSTSSTATDWASLGLGLALLIVLSLVILLIAVQAVPPALSLTQRLPGGNPTLLAVSLAFLVAFIFTIIGLPPIFGAFWAGTIVASSTVAEKAREYARPLTEVFSAVFFAAMGMLLVPAGLPALAGLAVLLVVLGAFAKFTGGFLVLRSLRTPVLPALACATILIPRGEIGLVIAQYAGEGELGQQMRLVASILMIATTLIAPFALLGIRRLQRPTPVPEPAST